MTITSKELSEISKMLFVKAGLCDEDASVIASDLVAANLRRLDSHGVSRIPMYIERIRRGVVNPRPIIKVERITSAVARVDGDNGMGFLAGHRAMSEAVSLAAESGIGLVGLSIVRIKEWPPFMRCRQ